MVPGVRSTLIGKPVDFLVSLLLTAAGFPGTWS
jgi:hypothetical protein